MGPPPPGGAPPPPPAPRQPLGPDSVDSAPGRDGLLNLDLGAGFRELLLDVLSLLLRDALLDLGGSTLDQVFGLLETERGHLAYHLDDVDLLVTGVLEDDVELGFLLGLLSGTRGWRARHRPPPRRGSGRDAEFAFQGLDQLVELEHCHPLDLFHELLNLRHLVSPLPDSFLLTSHACSWRCLSSAIWCRLAARPCTGALSTVPILRIGDCSRNSRFG